MADLDDKRWMRRCLTLARKGAGHVSPNPMVGAVLVDEETNVLGEGWHGRFGGPHAEVYAIAAAEGEHGADALRRATLYVNLEPCNHHGKTPPCTDLIVEKGIPRVVVGAVDANPLVGGKGIGHLRAAGVDVRAGILQDECLRFNEAYYHHVHYGCPLVTVKVAQTLDGRVATRTGDARWITGLMARTLVHRWRSELDGVLVGAGTARRDDPALTVRHVEGRQPVRVVLDRAAALPADRQLFTDAAVATTLAAVGEAAAAPAYEERLREGGGRLWRMPETQGHLDLHALLHRLGEEGQVGGLPMQSLLVEAGPRLATALLTIDLVDRYFAFVAPRLLGEGIPSLDDLGAASMREALSFYHSTWEPYGGDILFRGYRRSPAQPPRPA